MLPSLRLKSNVITAPEHMPEYSAGTLSARSATNHQNKTNCSPAVHTLSREPLHLKKTARFKCGSTPSAGLLQSR